MARTIIQKLQDKHNELRQTFKERGWEQEGQQIKKFIVPDRGRLLNGNRERESNEYDKNARAYVVDDTGEQANNFFVSGLVSMLTPETTPWFKLDTGDPSLEGNKRVGVWLDSVTSLILDVFSGTDTYSVLKSTYTELSSFGTGAQILFEDELDTILPVSLTWGEYLIGTDNTNKPDTILREFYMTAKQMEQQFGKEALSRATREQLKNNNVGEKRIRVFHLVEPADGRRGIKNPAGKPFNSFYWDENSTDKDRPLSIGGFEEFPAQIPRWSTISNDTYGKESPGMKQLQAIKGLQSMVRDIYIISKRVADPPLVSDINAMDVSNLPGSISTVVDSMGNTSAIQPLFQNYRPDLNALWAITDRTRELIEKGFFNNLFLSLQQLEGDRRTATEIVARNEEKFAMLGPVLNRIFNGLLEPMIDRTFRTLSRQGFFDENGEYPLPPELEGRALNIEYTSIIAQAQKAVGLNNVDRFIERLGLLANLDPSVLDNVDFDDVTRQYGKQVPASVFREVEEMIEMREQRALQQQAAAQMAAMESAASTSKDLSQAKLGTGSALDELAEEG